MNDSLLVDTKHITNWFNALRNLPENERTRALEAFWAGQIDSKCWLVNTLNDLVSEESNIYIFGGWIGVLASLLFQSAKFKVNHITNIDIDPWCEKSSREICSHVNNFYHVTSDMKEYFYDFDYYPNIVINTSTEHIDQGTYDVWFDRVPNDSLIVIQGNNFFDCNEHVRCSSSLRDFKRMNYVNKSIFEGTLPHDLYNRYMCVFKK